MVQVIEICLIVILLIMVVHHKLVTKWKEHKKKKRRTYFEIIFIDPINNLKTKIQGGYMSKEISVNQNLEFDVVFKNKNGNPAFVDGAIRNLQFKDPNTREVLAVTASATAETVTPDEAGNSSRHHIKVITTTDDISKIITAALTGTVDVDIENDHDDSTSDDVKEKEFDFNILIFKPLEAVTTGVENETDAVDNPA